MEKIERDPQTHEVAEFECAEPVYLFRQVQLLVQRACNKAAELRALATVDIAYMQPSTNSPGKIFLTTTYTRWNVVGDAVIPVSRFAEVAKTGGT